MLLGQFLRLYNHWEGSPLWVNIHFTPIPELINEPALNKESSKVMGGRVDSYLKTWVWTYATVLVEGNGTPLQCSCLENPMDGGAWWAPVHEVTKESDTTERLRLVLQSDPTLCNSMDCSLPGSSDHGILKARILEWVAMPSSRGSSQPRN